MTYAIFNNTRIGFVSLTDNAGHLIAWKGIENDPEGPLTENIVKRFSNGREFGRPVETFEEASALYTATTPTKTA